MFRVGDCRQRAACVVVPPAPSHNSPVRPGRRRKKEEGRRKKEERNQGRPVLCPPAITIYEPRLIALRCGRNCTVPCCEQQWLLRLVFPLLSPPPSFLPCGVCVLCCADVVIYSGK